MVNTNGIQCRALLDTGAQDSYTPIASISHTSASTAQQKMIQI